MFASTTIEGHNVDEVLLCYTDPNPLLPKRETWPPGGVLRDDIEKYAFHKKLLSVVFVSCMQEERPPFVLGGHLCTENNSFMIRSPTDDKYHLRFAKFRTENKRLVKKRNEGACFQF